MIETILCLSDTHNFHRRLGDLPDADVVIHCGDFTSNGTEAEALDFIEWFCDLPHRHKIFIPGNHDVCMYGAKIDGLDTNCYFLNNSGITIDELKFYGVPFFIEGFEDRYAHSIPDDTDVLITHQPPQGILDEAAMEDITHFGSSVLLERISAVRPAYCLFGHVHADYGTTEKDGITYVNCSALRGDGELNAPVLLRPGRRQL